MRFVQQAPREAPPQTIELPADLVFSARLYDFERAYAWTRGHVGGPPPPAAPKCRFASEPAVPLRSGWSGHCLQIVERVLTTLRLRKTQDKCQSLRDRGAGRLPGGSAAAAGEGGPRAILRGNKGPDAVASPMRRVGI